tara:strand:+ start:828 stop:1904 length:1077 start_codon:yes stop_codon:yes gene_type:complete
MKAHEFADIFPLMNPKGFKELKIDIKEHGQQDEIITYKGEILDGRNRYNACKEIGIKPRTKEFTGSDPLQYVMSTNLKRRHLTDSQKAIVGRRYKVYYSVFAKERMSIGGQGVELVPQQEQARARDKAGEVVGVSGRYIDMAEEVLQKKPEMEETLMTGELSLKQVHRTIKLEEQKKEIELLKEVTGEFDVIVIDPPWKVDHNYSPDHYMGRVANPYPEMSIEEIKKIKLPAKDNCILWLWTTHSQIWNAKELLSKWDFEYKGILVWNKEYMGIGKWLRKQCEFCLLAVKGNPIWTATDVRDIITEKRTSHSTKPESFYEMIDQICVGRKLEYFSRKQRDGWEVYGDEINNPTKGGEE